MIDLQTLHSALREHPSILGECHGFFSQNGEDIIVRSLLGQSSERGTFVDIGAYHPFRFSNTFMLYLEGWRGTNVDANSNAVELFKQVRPDDVSVRMLVSDCEEELEYFSFAEGAWNTSNPEAAKMLDARGRPESSIVGVEKMTTVHVNTLLEQHVGSKRFDFLNIDVEGLDDRILFAIDFERFRPTVIAAEIDIVTCMKEPMTSFLKAKGYRLYSFYQHTAILLRTRD